jgi:hypothetical protein
MACARAIRAVSWSKGTDVFGAMFDSPLQPTWLATSKRSGNNNLGIGAILSLFIT